MGEIPQGWMSWTTGDRRSHWNLDERHFPILIIKCSQLKSFGGKAKDFSPRARMRGMLGYQMPFDRWSLLAESSCDIDHSFSGMIGLLTEMELKWDTLSITTTLPRTPPPLKSLLNLMSDLLWTAEQQCGIEWRSGRSRSLEGVSKSRYFGISIPIKYSNFSRFYKKMSPFYKKIQMW